MYVYMLPRNWERVRYKILNDDFYITYIYSYDDSQHTTRRRGGEYALPFEWEAHGT